MKKALIISFGLLLSTFVIGCSHSQDLYYWGDYSNTLYELKKSPDEKSMAAHTEMLKSIIENSKKLNKRVPPGVYCEYGYMLLKTNHQAEARQYFELEMQTYPESKVFIDRLLMDTAKTAEKK
ncbi:MAG: DUF4810 domain-containing protein [Ignavibacteria bacterium]|jgi:hypothetical protein|nr:DUF4810 domain-containing protein [Ignavibacteria bacterium]MCU7502082.1 DUF4810 domain-containing protein [Ignavibacteria bacterium]MCU7515484.1 DUF4810 domain-containing protein [Ignavibacteria bacterium]